MDCKNPEAEITSGQTFGLFKIVKRDYRNKIAERDINRGQFASLMNEVYGVAKASGWDINASRAETERLLDTFPLR